MHTTVTVRQIGTVTIVDLSGRIEIGHGETVLRVCVGSLLKRNCKHILLNLAKVPLMDSAAVGELVACLKRVKAAGGDLKLLNPTNSVFRPLELTKLADLFEVHTDESEAIATFRTTNAE